MSKVFLLTGTNLGKKITHLQKALSLIENSVGKVLNASSVVSSPAWGFDSENRFLNQALEVETMLTPLEVLEAVQRIERQMGRERNKGNMPYSDRVIDIDILFYDDIIMNTEALSIPHLMLHKRGFALFPLTQIAPHFVHPVLKERMEQLWENYPDKNEITNDTEE